MPALTAVQLQALGQLIMDSNPYLMDAIEKTSAGGATPTTRRASLRGINMTLDTQQVNRSGKGAQWTFRGSPYDIRGALRVSYCYEDDFENMVEEHLLIGFEGSYTG